MGPSSSSCSCLRLKLGQGKTTNLESPGNAESFIQGRCGCGAQSHRLGPILLGMSLAVCGVWHSLELGSALSGWRADCHEGFPTIEVGKTSQVPPSGAGSICWRMQVVPERRGRSSREFPSGSQTSLTPLTPLGSACTLQLREKHPH